MFSFIPSDYSIFDKLLNNVHFCKQTLFLPYQNSPDIRNSKEKRSINPIIGFDHKDILSSY